MESISSQVLDLTAAVNVVSSMSPLARLITRGAITIPPEELPDAVATLYPLVVGGAVKSYRTRSTPLVVEACGVMLNEHLRHLVVAIDGDRVGIVSLRDLAAVLLQAADPHLGSHRFASQSKPQRRSGSADQRQPEVCVPGRSVAVVKLDGG